MNLHVEPLVIVDRRNRIKKLMNAPVETLHMRLAKAPTFDGFNMKVQLLKIIQKM